MSWLGMSRQDGTKCCEMAHIRQSISDILTTPVGSRVMRREYGSYLNALIDQPHNPATRQRLLAAAVMALHRWEPRVRIERIQVAFGKQAGEVDIELDAVRVDGARRRHPDPINLQLQGIRL